MDFKRDGSNKHRKNRINITMTSATDLEKVKIVKIRLEYIVSIVVKKCRQCFDGINGRKKNYKSHGNEYRKIKIWSKN